MTTLKDAAAYGANLVAHRLGYEVRPWRVDPQAEVVFPHLRPEGQDVVVELGPGTGRFSRHLAARLTDGELRLVDHSPFVVDFLRRYFRANPRVSVHLNDGAS